MTQDVLTEYRAKKLEEEFFEKATFPRPCELGLKHGKSRATYWGKFEEVAASSTVIEDRRMNLRSILCKTKRDMPVMVTLILPEGMGLESVMTPCQYMETDRGYNVISIVISGLIMMNIVNFWMAITMTSVGTEAFTSPFFLLPLGAVMGSLIVAWRFNQTHFTHRLSVECYEPDKELGIAHLVYAVDCDIPVHKQLWFVNFPDLLRSAIAEHQEVLNEHMLDMRMGVGEKNAQIDSIIRDRNHEVTLQANRAPLMNAKTDIWSNPVVVMLAVGMMVAVAAVIVLLTGG